MSVASQWAQYLGLATTPLFSPGFTSSPGEHYALLDGRRASFACSVMEAPDITQVSSQSWQWSADLAHHVVITPSEVHVQSGRDPLVRNFRRASVDSRLDSFLTFLDSRRSALPDVVSYLVEEFRQIWGANSSLDGQGALAAFLIALQAMDHSDLGILDDPTWCQRTAIDLGIDDPSLVGTGFNQATIERAKGMRDRAPLGLKLIPSLVLRHTSGRLFQEAHAILESAQFGLFGNSSITTTPIYSPSGAYFTPVPIARMVAEWALQPWIEFTDELVIADFACGSAVFLTEALRSLERNNFKGRVRLVGRDKSMQAITMAKVAVRAILRDMPTMQVVSDMQQADAFQETWPKAHVILMNPPFRSWERMNATERDWVHEVTRGIIQGRPDLSVGFIERAVRSLHPSGTLATLLPAGILGSDSLSKWRDDLMRRTTPTLIAVLGEHGLFQHALVNVGVLALQGDVNGIRPHDSKSLHVAWSSAETGAASQVIRAIRRSMSGMEESLSFPKTSVSDWSLTTTSLRAWQQRPSWLPGAGALGPLLETIQTQIATKVEDVFHVRQGIRTGANEVFIQPASVVDGLPRNERSYFRQSADAASFVEGEIQSRNYLFVPSDTWTSEADVMRSVPKFYNQYLRTAKDTLIKRKSLLDGHWWKLTRARTWAFQGHPRLLSKRFGLYPSFARDFEVKFAAVQANAWTPTERLIAGKSEESIREILTSYWWLLNSRIMVALLREYCPNVAGGQLDLEHKYVKHVPLPNLSRQFSENPGLQVLATSIRSRYPERLPMTSDLDQFAAAAFGTDIKDWNLSGLESLD
jgi:hypothetical protein